MINIKLLSTLIIYTERFVLPWNVERDLICTTYFDTVSGNPKDQEYFQILSTYNDNLNSHQNGYEYGAAMK